MKIELKGSEVGEFHDGRDTELPWTLSCHLVNCLFFIILYSDQHKKKFYCMKPLYLKIIVLIVTNPQWVGDSSLGLLSSVDRPI